jgi:hypothetical protein
MQVNFMIAMILAASLLAQAEIAEAQNSPAALSTSPPPAGTAPPAVSERADQLLKQMSDYIGSAEQLTFHANISFDHVLPSGQKLQFAATEDVALKRPDGLYVEWQSDLGDRQFWYDGKSITLHDPASSFYATAPAVADLDTMLDQLVSKIDFVPPLADFLYHDPYRSVRARLQYGIDLGLNQVDGRSCRTLAFVERDIDWQIWIDPGPQLTPCKLVITYKTQPGQPQFTAVFTDWDFAPRIAESVFTPDLPPGTERVPFAPVVASANPK